MTRVAREFARNAERSNGRSMIMMGGGTNHWYHSDQIYRSMLDAGAALRLPGRQRRRLGALRRPGEGAADHRLVDASRSRCDWVRPPRQQADDAVLVPDQRPVALRAHPRGRVRVAARHGDARRTCTSPTASRSRRASAGCRSYPELRPQPARPRGRRRRRGASTPPTTSSASCEAGRLRFACEDPDAPENHARVMTLWRANLLGSSSKGHEYFLRHVLGVEQDAIRNEEAPPELRTRDVVWRDEAPVGKLDLFTTIDFRMNGSALYSDVVLPAATWYEKHDLSSTDLHPFVHSFNEAVPPPWETRTDYEAFKRIAQAFSRLAEKHLGVRRDLVAAPLLHDTPDELAQPFGEVRDWRAGECEPIPGKTMPKLLVVERDYPAVAEQWAALGPLVEEAGIQVEGRELEAGRRGRRPARSERRRARGSRGGPAVARARRRLVRGDPRALVGTTNGRLSLEGFRSARAARRAPARRPRRGARRRADHLRRHAGAAAQGARLAGVVGHRVAHAPLLAVHDQRRPARAVADAFGPAALLRRPRVDPRVRRDPARLPSADRRPAARRRAAVGEPSGPRCTSAS